MILGGIKIKRKLCSKCRRRKPIEQFCKDSQKKDQRYSSCKGCMSGYKRKNYDPVRKAKRYKEVGWACRIKREYDLTPEEYEKMWRRQKGVCALDCGRKIAAIDHDHTTGVVRGLLCIGCNRALGTLGDSEEGLMRALNYVKQNSSLAKER